MSPVASSRLDAYAVGQLRAVGDPADEGVVEAHALGAAVEPDRRLGALEDHVLVAEVEAEALAERLVAQAHGEERLLRGEQVVDGAAERRDLGVVALARVARSGADDDQVGAVEGPGRVVLVPDDAGGHAEDPEHVDEHVHEVVLAVEDHHRLPGQPRVGRLAGLVGQPEAGEPLVARAQRQYDVLVARQLGDVGAVGGRRRRQAEGAEDAAGLGPRLGHLVGGVGVAHQRRAGRHLELPCRRDVGGADQDRAVHRRGAVGRAAEERERGAVVAAALGLVVGDQPAGVLDGRARHRRGVHRVAQDLAVVAVGAAGEEVLRVDQVRHRLEERPEHLAALVADVAHHLELLVDHHEELEDLLLVGEEVEQPLLEGLGGRVAVARDERRRIETRPLRDAEGAGDRVHPYVALAHRDVPLRAGADQEPLTGEEAEGPVGAALALHQAPQHRQRLRGVPVGDDGAVVAADDEVGPLALADLVADDRLDDLAVVLVAGGEPTTVGELDRHVGQRLEQVVDRHLVLGLDVDDRQRGAVVDGGEAALAHLPERHGDQPVRAPARLRRTRSRAGCRAGSRPRAACRRPGPPSVMPCAG